MIPGLSVEPLSGLAELARVTGIPSDRLVRSLEIERVFRERILSEPDADCRRGLYAELYEAVHALQAGGDSDLGAARLARLFRGEFRGKSVLDVGCGDGSLLRAIAATASPRRLTGMDVHDFRSAGAGVGFFRQDVASFRLPEPVDVVLSSQLLEHLAPADLPEHLRCVRNALRPGGLFVLLTPNRLWGPHDVTRVVDFTNSNRVPAAGSHLNELTYGELIPILAACGFGRFRTIIPFADRIPAARRVRLAPWFNLLLERCRWLREATYAIRWRGRACYKNPIILISIAN